IALDQARKLLSSDERTCLLPDLPLGPLLAQCCGGHVRLLIESLDPKDKAWLGSCLEAIDANRSVTLRTFLDNVSPRKLVIEEAHKGKNFVFIDKTGADLLSSRPRLTDCAQMIETLSQERPQLRLYGAGHVGRAAADVMRHTVFDVTCYDDRESERMLLPTGVAIMNLPDADSVIESAPPQCHHVVLTHSHDLDYALVRAILRRDDFAYLGLIGSLTKRSRFVSRLRQEGVDDSSIARLTCPIGTPGIGSKRPEAVAIALAHELLAKISPSDEPRRG
ncbi:MAG: xanthine dehydrogenase accessory protein XdhC, partial [Pseudomonadota bacterium]